MQRSEDGVNFSTIGFVASYAEGGQSNTALNYTFRDHDAALPVLYYRYKQIDHNGNQSYSNVVVIKDANLQSSTALNVYPNPLMKTQLLSLNNTAGGTLFLFNAQGVLVHKEFVSKSATLKLPVSLASGTYFTTLQTSTGKQSATFVLQ